MMWYLKKHFDTPEKSITISEIFSNCKAALYTPDDQHNFDVSTGAAKDDSHPLFL